MRKLTVAVFLMFAIFAILQFNDPDRWTWIGLYGFAAVLAGLANFNKYPIALLSLGLLLYPAGIIN